MKYIKKYNLFESSTETEIPYYELMGRLLHLYGSIPVPKEKSSVVIRRVILASMGKTFELGENVNINYCKVHDKIRFSDYFDSLLKDKDIRGHNFEGLVCGLFGGNLSTRRDSKYDLIIGDKRYSVKFVDNKTKAPEIGKFKNIIQNTLLDEKIIEEGGLTRLFKGANTDLKRKVWENISTDIDGWILAYPDNIESPSQIIVNIVNKEDMYTILSRGYVVAPKGGYNDIYSLALSSKYRNLSALVKTSIVSIPQVTRQELLQEYRSIEEEKWANYVFGEMGNKIRPDVLRYIKNNKDEITNKLRRLSEF